MAKPSPLYLLLAPVIVIAGFVYWQQQQSTLPNGLYVSNGRLEAEQIEVATKTAGRVKELAVHEGQMVQTGDLIATLDAEQVTARQQQSMAGIEQAIRAKEEASAAVIQRKSQLKLAKSELERTTSMYQQKIVPQDAMDKARAQFESAQAALQIAEASVKRADASIDGAQAGFDEVQSVIDDTQIKAPQSGRIQYTLTNTGEVLAAGGRVVTLLDVSDVYMTIFVPASVAGKLSLNGEARLILDPVPEYVIPATVSFIAGDAQFTPKSVETHEERDNLMFKVKLRIEQALLEKYQEKVKTGVRGLAYVRTDDTLAWPQNLAVKLP
jgi:HlyD family secretion protein